MNQSDYCQCGNTLESHLSTDDHLFVDTAKQRGEEAVEQAGYALSSTAGGGA